MHKCALCELDCGEISLPDGRCPRCGSIMHWPDTLESEKPVAAQVPRALGGEQPVVANEYVERIWRESISNTTSLNATLKCTQSEPTASDSIFSVQTREVRSAGQALGVPADYEILNVIGRGGVGVVYAARQASIDRTVAVKMLRDEYRSRPDHGDKFLAEAVLTGELDHPNIVPIYDLGRSADGELFYSMKNVVGTPWDAALSQKSLRENPPKRPAKFKM